jgi:serine/threonine-protein kinase RsbW/stage II sporulation protein AB (anti-sigma F factor)
VKDSVPDARHAVVRYLNAATTADPPLGDIAVVVSEAVTNVVMHAYREEEGGDVRVGVAFSPEEIELTVEDDGDGMVPRPDSPGAGLGLPLIALLSERFDASSMAGGGTRVRAWFRRELPLQTHPATGA